MLPRRWTMAQRSYKYKLKPTSKQQRALDRTLALCCELYNTALSERRMIWQQRGKSLAYLDQKAELPALKKEHPEFAAVHSQVLQDVILRVERAFAAYFRRCAVGETPGYPRFQGAGRYRSFTYPQFGNGVSLEEDGVTLSKIGHVAVRWSRPLEGTPKTVTLTREADGWYICFSCADVPLRPLPPTGHETGIDLGLKVFLVCADGSRVENPRFHRPRREGAEEGAPPGLAAQTGQQAAAQSGLLPGEEIREGAPPAG